MNMKNIRALNIGDVQFIGYLESNGDINICHCLESTLASYQTLGKYFFKYIVLIVLKIL
jgi:hypothetical protein